MARILITGGAGFIGSHLAERLVGLGHDVRILDNFSSGKRAHIESLSGSCEILEGDVRDPDACRNACRDVQIILHQAAIPSVPKSVEQPRSSHDANVTGTFNMLEAAVREKVRRFIYAASSSAYGDTNESPKHEGLKPAPLSPYAVQKLAGEHYGLAFHKCFGLETISLRYFNVFGPRQDPNSPYAAAIPAFISALLRGEPPIIYGDGEQTRDFTYIENAVLGNVLAMQAKGKSLCGQSVNIACGGAITINRVVRRINELLGTNVAPRHGDPRPGDVRHSCADISLAKDLLGYQPITSFDEGLAKTVDYVRASTPCPPPMR